VGTALGADRVVAFLRRAGTPAERVNDRRCIGLVLAVLLLAGFALRIDDLAGPGLSLDEAMHEWMAASRTLGELWSNQSTRSPHPIGYFLLLHEILRWTWDPFWLRFPSVLAGTALIGAGYVFVRRMVSVPAGLVMALLLTFSPSLLELSRTARNYPIAFLLLLVTTASFVRWQQRDRGRDALAYAAAGAAGLMVHYFFAFVLAAQYAQAGCAALLARRPVPWWTRTFLRQLPVLATAALLYRFHLSLMDPRVQGDHEAMYRSYMTLSAADWWSPMLAVWGYLSPQGLALPGMIAWLLGLALFLVRRNFLAFFVCTLPVLLAAAVSSMGLYPLHGSRHSAYLFAFLFPPVAALLAELAGAGAIASLGPASVDDDGTEPGSPEPLSPWTARAGLMIVAAVLAVVVDASVAEWSSSVPAASADGKVARVPEFLKSYRRTDLDRAFRILESQARPNDVVLLTTEALYGVRFHYGLRPLPAAEAGERPAKNPQYGGLPVESGMLQLGGVHYYATPRLGMLLRWLDPNSVLDVYEAIRDEFGVKPGGSLWVMRGGWDPSLSSAFRKMLPGLALDQQVSTDTADILLRIDAKDLAMHLALRRALRKPPAAGSVVPLP